MGGLRPKNNFPRQDEALGDKIIASVSNSSKFPPS
jgi:hypothetical protein